MKAIHSQFIGIYENAFSDNFCDEVVSFFEKNSSSHFTRDEYWGDNKLSSEDVSVELEHFKKDHPDYSYVHNIKSQINNKIGDLYFTQYYKKYPSIPPSIRLETIKLQRTYPTQGYHVWHSEAPKFLKIANEHKNPEETNEQNQEQLHRFGAYTIYLNDVEEGGETEFLYQSLRVKPKKGTLCIFPAYFTHTHRGNPPLSGGKYIATSWIYLNYVP